MITTYSSKEGERVDEIAYRHYGSVEGGIVEAVYDANPGLAELGPSLPADVSIILPEVTQEAPAARLQLFS